MDRFDMALALMAAFPGSFLYYNGEFIAHKKSNTYLNLRCCENEEDLKCRVLEFFSRAAHKTSPYKTERYNEEFHKFMLDGINEFLGTAFDKIDMDLIYTYLGNRCNHELTVEFVRSGYDMTMLWDRYERDGGPFEAIST